ncbi:MAG: Gfo/Idh/MocA family oxidoreductase [Clostridiales bacterium]|jgi:myo-inositol 2-dehydrogenase/D-chiro-inositol 1-dehydrogenase|nr:Gfo/Idh/MocA family oxidoreductase [Clostridiales bacterium]
MERKLRVLLVGAAFSADLHMDGYARMRDRVEIAAIADKDISRIRALAERYGVGNYEAYGSFEEAIARADVDLVDICMPNFLHHAVAMAALKKGRHIICEKPLATTYEDGREIVETAERVGKKVYYAEDWLGAPALQKALQIVREGGIGEVKFMRLRECHNGSHSPFAQTIQYCGGGSMIHLGIHPVGFMLALKENRWKELTAMTSGGGENNLIHRTMEGEDWAACLMKFADGTVAILESNYVSEGGMEDSIDFYGTLGCLHVDLTFSSAIRAFSKPGLSYTVEKADITTGWSNPAVDEKYNLGYVAEIAHFVDCAKSDADARVGLRGVDGLEALKVVRLIYESAETGRRIVNDSL